MQRALTSPLAVVLLATAASTPLGCGDPSDPPPNDAGAAGNGAGGGVGSGGTQGSGGASGSGGAVGTGGSAGVGGAGGASGRGGSGGVGGALPDGSAGTAGTSGGGGGSAGVGGSGGAAGGARDGAAGSAPRDAVSDGVTRDIGMDGVGGAAGSGGSGPNTDAGDAGACASGQVGTPPNCFPPPPVPPGSGRKWTVTFSEEFNGTDFDHKKLSPCFDWNGGGCTDSFNKGREHYDPAQITVSNGTAKLTAAPLMPPMSSTACFENQCSYKSGLLSTCRPNANSSTAYLYTFTYGYVESRMKFPATQGFFTAFWMLPANPSYNYRSEIDIVEILGDDPKTIYMTYHYNDRSQSHAVNQGKGNNGACAVKDYGTDFHDFGIDWQPDHVAWYIDGAKCSEFTGTTAQVENGPMQIIIDLMVDHKWQQDWKVTLQDTTLVRALELDYLRVYQQVP